MTPGGALDRLLAENDPLYLDLSARSGCNALARDPAFTQGFVERHWRRMRLGTDIVHAGDERPILEWLRTLEISQNVRAAIADGNARRLLGLKG